MREFQITTKIKTDLDKFANLRSRKHLKIMNPQNLYPTKITDFTVSKKIGTTKLFAKPLICKYDIDL